MKRLRGAVAGCGYFARFHLEAWRRMEDVEIVAACDPDQDRARQAAPRAYSSLEALLEAETLDFVDIATRPEAHLEMVRSAAGRGVAMICQKPMAPTWEQAVALVEAAESAGVPLMIHENWRWQPWYRFVAGRLEAGDIGPVLTYRFRIRQRDGLGPAPYPAQPYFRDMPRLLVYETLVHPIDTARFLFGDIAGVYAESRRVNPIIAGEDLVLMVLAHRSGLTGAIDGHRFLDLQPASPVLGDAEVEGEAGVLTVTAAGHVLKNGACIWENRVAEGYRGDSVFATQRHFIDCLLNGREFETSGRRYLATFAAVEAAYCSAAEGRRVDPGEWLKEAPACLPPESP